MEYNDKILKKLGKIWNDHSLILRLILLSLAAISILFILVCIPSYQISQLSTNIDNNTIELADLENKYRATIAQILGGIAILVGIWLTYKNWETSKQGQITERFTRAIEHLGKDGLEFKLGGIYALERIAHESEKDHWPIMEILTAYIRKNSPIQVSEKIEESEQACSKLSIDTQAVLDVFKRRKMEHECNEFRRLDLNETCLRQAILPEANLSEAYLSGAFLPRCNLSKAYLFEANLSEAYLFKANLTRADLRGADLRGADLRGADLRGADLREAIIDEKTCFDDSKYNEKTLCDENIKQILEQKGIAVDV